MRRKPVRAWKWSNINSPSGSRIFTPPLEALGGGRSALKQRRWWFVVSGFRSCGRVGGSRSAQGRGCGLIEAEEMPWCVSGLTRSTAQVIERGEDNRHLFYGGYTGGCSGD